MQKLLAALALALAFPALAHAGDVSMQVRDEPLATRTLAVAAPQRPFNMLGLHWQGSGHVLFRTHHLHGSWSGWQEGDADAMPDGGTGAWHDGNPVWTGASDRLEVKTLGRVSRVRSYRLWSRVESRPARSLSTAGSPAIVTRSGWGADEEIVRSKPLYTSSLSLAIIHHTVNSNTYTPAQAAAIVRGIEIYHVRGNGWNDIGYNFLIDRFGTIYEGRGGGITRNVVGAHALGFNRKTVGISLIGNFQNATPPPAMLHALVSLLAWRLDVAHIDPLSTVDYASGGSIKFRPGQIVRLRAISGHRDAYFTECPGIDMYRLLPTIASEVAATGQPKLYGPTVTGTLGGPVRFQATLSAAAAWTVTVADPAGAVAATGTGRGSAVDWTWPSKRGAYTWTIAVPGSRPARGTLGAAALPPPPPTTTTPVPTPPPPVPAAIGALQVTPAAIVPDATGAVGSASVSFTLSTPATIAVGVVDANGTSMLSVAAGTEPAGPVTLGFAAAGLPDGRYTLAVTARHGTATTSAAAPFVVDRSLAGPALSAPAVSPNGDGRSDTVAFTFSLAHPAPVSLVIMRGALVVATPFQGPLAAGSQTIAWDGTSGGGLRLPDGAYDAVLTWTDALGDISLTIPVAVDTTAPVLTLLDKASLRFSLSEAATVAIVVNGGSPTGQVEPAGVFTLAPPPEGVASVWAQATDEAGNSSPPLTG